MPGYQTTTVADKAALDTWISQHPNAVIHSITQDGTDLLVLYTEPDLPTATYRDSVNTEAVVNKLD